MQSNTTPHEDDISRSDFPIQRRDIEVEAFASSNNGIYTSSSIHTDAEGHTRLSTSHDPSGTLDRPQCSRPEKDRFLVQLSYHLIATYNWINTNYYERRKEEHRGFMSSKKKMREMKESYPLSNSEEIFHDRYKVNGKLVGRGSFGLVVEGYDMKTGASVAIKIIKKKKNVLARAQNEVSILKMLHKSRHPGQSMIVCLKDSFIHRDFHCLVFELLSGNLYEVLKCNHFKGIGLQFLRKIAGQILQALEYMASVNVIHCDLKPENILLVHPNHTNIRIVDFGSSCLSHVQYYEYIQSRFYRAPEVLLGIKYTLAIDIWSLACIMVELHTGKPLFAGKDRFDQMRLIVGTLGLPPASLIQQSPPKYRQEFFSELPTLDQQHVKYSLLHSKDQNMQQERPSSLRDILGVDNGGPGGQWIMDPYHTRDQYLCFLDVVERMLNFDPNSRITPTEALNHPFFSTNTVFNRSQTNKKAKCMRGHSSSMDYCENCCETPIASNRVKQRRIGYSESEGLYARR